MVEGDPRILVRLVRPSGRSVVERWVAEASRDW